MPAPIPDTVTHLRERHGTFHYTSFSVTPDNRGLRLDYRFAITPDLEFSPYLLLPLKDPSLAAETARDPVVQRLAFLIGMVELLSYWKLCCPPRIMVAAGYLSDDELPFWENLIRKGLGEFFFTNNIPPTIEFSIVCSGPRSVQPKHQSRGTSGETASTLVLVGGGKDSIVTLELLRQTVPAHSLATNSALNAFALNPIAASIDAIRAAQYPEPLVASRTIDPKLLELNARGYLNGHTPFSALLAFAATLTAYINGYGRVLASNEASASEGNVEYHGFEINHQYSKSYEFEADFRGYIGRLQLPVEYTSFLRPLNELQICALFSDMPQYHSIFRSCNREQTLTARSRSTNTTPAQLHPKRSGWCANCPKCVFTFLCMRCFLSQEHLNEIFGTDPRSQPDFDSLVSQLAGFAAHKPFECVGTYEEVRAALMLLAHGTPPALPATEQSLALLKQVHGAAPTPCAELIRRWNNHNFLDLSLETLLRGALAQLQGRFSQ